MELKPEGKGYQAKTRLANFINLPELINMFKEIADIKTSDMLELSIPKAEYINEKIKASPEQKAFIEALADRAEKIRAGAVNPKEDNMLVVTNDGRKCALDQCLVGLPEGFDENKTDRCTQNILREYKNSEEMKGTQLVFCDLSTPKGDECYNTYDDLKRKLTKAGIPASEIEFIHDARTEKAKEELFGKVRAGTVRVLIGSTQKMGTGTNVQERMIALHHIDCPWRPADLEQQEGRILRQGNCNKTVRIYRYVTENTFDAYMWQILENKQKFIAQIMTSKTAQRRAEDVDDTTLSYAEVKSLATGNPLIKEKMDLDIAVTKLRLLKNNYINNRYELEREVKRTLPERMEHLKTRLNKVTEDIPSANKFTAETPKKEGQLSLTDMIESSMDADNAEELSFTMYVGDIVYSERKTAGEAMMQKIRASNETQKVVEIGNIGGFDVSVIRSFSENKLYAQITGSAKYTCELGYDAVGNTKRITNCIAAIPSEKTRIEEELERTEKRLVDATAVYEMPFDHESELVEKQARLTELNQLLLVGKSSTEAFAYDDSDNDVVFKKNNEIRF